MTKFSRNQWIALIITVLVMSNAALIITIALNTKRLRDEYKVSKSWQCKKDIKEFMRNELNLTDKQLEFFETERERHFADKKPVQAKMDSLRNQMRAEVFKTEPDTLKIKKMANSLGLLQTNLELLVASHFSKLTHNLSHEQRATFEILIKKQKQHRYKGKDKANHPKNKNVPTE
jgi:Spy/CpxP family protein refolding chaperone